MRHLDIDNVLLGISSKNNAVALMLPAQVRNLLCKDAFPHIAVGRHAAVQAVRLQATHDSRTSPGLSLYLTSALPPSICFETEHADRDALRTASGVNHEVLPNGPTHACCFVSADCSACFFDPTAESVAMLVLSLSRSVGDTFGSGPASN